MGPDAADDRQEVGPRRDQLAAIVGGDAADRHDGTVVTSLHWRSNSSEAWVLAALVPVGKKAPKAT